MKTTHTPGPWKASWNGLWQIQTKSGWLIANVWPAKHAPHFEPENVEANARLIAAAPELLGALETLLDCSPCQNGCDPSDMTCASNLARAAIAKAKGQS